MGLQVLDFFLVPGQQGLEVVRQIVEIQAATVAIAQHLAGAVLAGNDDKAASVDVKGIVRVGVPINTRGLGKGQFQVGGSRGLE